MEFTFKSLGDGAAELTAIALHEDVECLCLPAQTPEGETVTGIDKTGLKIQGRIDSSGKGSLKKIRSVHIPDTYSRVDKADFRDLDGMVEWVVDPENKSLASLDGLLYAKDLKTLLSCPAGRSGEVRVPEGTLQVGAGAFAGCFHLKKVVLPESVRSIGPDAFYLTDIEVYIPGGDVRIHERAFDSEYVYPSIYAPRGSSAQRYAEKYDVCFVPGENAHVR